MKEIIIEFDEDGDIQIEGKGFEGRECDKEMKFIEELGDVKERKNKPEYYRKAKNNVKGVRK